METDYEHMCKELLFRALKAMVESIESTTKEKTYKDPDGIERQYHGYSDFTGQDVYYVHKALMTSQADQDAAKDAIADGIAKGIIGAMNL